MRKIQFPLSKIRVELANALTASQPANSSNWIHLAQLPVLQASWLQTTVQCEKKSLVSFWKALVNQPTPKDVSKLTKQPSNSSYSTSENDAPWRIWKFATFRSATLPFCQAQGFNHWGLLDSRVVYVRSAWEACFDVRAKTRVVQICQVWRQVHLADVFHGGLFVIKLGRTKALQTRWNSSRNSGRHERWQATLY